MSRGSVRPLGNGVRGSRVAGAHRRALEHRTSHRGQLPLAQERILPAFPSRWARGWCRPTPGSLQRNGAAAGSDPPLTGTPARPCTARDRNGALLAHRAHRHHQPHRRDDPQPRPVLRQRLQPANVVRKFLEINPVLVDELRSWAGAGAPSPGRRGDVSSSRTSLDVRRRPPRTRSARPTSRWPPARKWVDMGISRNLYLQRRDLQAMEEVYLTAWRRG